MDKKFVGARRRFIEEFERKTGDKIDLLELAEVAAEPFVLAEMGLAAAEGQKGLWGIFVFCEKGLYFYSKPSDNTFTALLRAASGASLPQEQMCALDKLPGFRAEFPLLGFFQKLSRRNSCRLDFEFSSKNGQPLSFQAFFVRTAEALFVPLQKYCRP